MNTRRPLVATIAAVLLGLLSLLSLAFPLLQTEGVAAYVVYSDVALGLAGLVAVAGLWTLRQWGFWLAVVVLVLNILTSAPGIFTAPTVSLQVSTASSVAVYALILVLLLSPVSRRSYA